MKTYLARPSEIQRKWYVADADGKILGRFASEIAQILRGKRKPIYSPHLDVGDHVIVINASQIQLTGRKADQKIYWRHSGYPGGLKGTPFKELLAKKPERVIRRAVWGMLPHNRLGRQMIKKLKVYAGSEHVHQSQSPEPIEL
ncbi:MAG: 50S ribosomal protein L13 [Candidatus Latescibacterota bacterium]|nr:MAG: 50S ribosomal protein L13 [Candidatus Latescibacterota bacterium]